MGIFIVFLFEIPASGTLKLNVTFPVIKSLFVIVIVALSTVTVFTPDRGETASKTQENSGSPVPPSSSSSSEA